ncbi:MAG: hypothetical protein RIC85_00525 [Gammaproteobacteria bacterium]
MSLDTDVDLLHLLRKSVEFAKSTTYYSRKFFDVDPVTLTLMSFGELPLTPSADFSADSLSFLVSDVPPDYIGITSGSTFGKQRSEPLFIFRTAEQRQSHSQLIEMIDRPRRGLAPLTMFFLTSNHGLSSSLPRRGCFAMPLEKSYHFEAIHKLLTTEFSFPGYASKVSALTGPLNMLKLFTVMCMERGISADTFDIKRVFVGGWQLTETWSDLLCEYWGVDITEIYGVSEVPAMLSSRPSVHEGFVFHPGCHIEFVDDTRTDLSCGKPVWEGLATVVATALYPLSAGQPLVRYVTDDIVNLRRPLGGEHAPEFDLVGRKKDCLMAGKSYAEGLLFAPLPFNNEMDKLHDIARNDNPRATIVGIETRFGWQKYRVNLVKDARPMRIEIEIELTWDPRIYPADAKLFETAISDLCLRLFPKLRDALSADTVVLDIRLFRPGATSLAAVF